jgi:GNAT superfamily N-acetyltransferase
VTGSATDDVDVRLYQPGDEEGIAELLQVTFGVWPKIETSASAAEHVLWKLSSDPESLRFQVVAAAGNKIVGCRLFLFNWFRICGERFCCRQGFDLAIDPNYQGRGILNDMWSYARKHFDDLNDFNFGVGAHPAALHMRVAQGNIVIENKVQVLSQRLDAVPERESERQVEVRQIDCFDGRSDELFESCVSSFDFIRERTSSYLNWRFADKRAGRFTMLAAMSGQEMLGYVVVTRAKDVGIIADILASSGRDDVIDALLRAASERLAAEGCLSMDCWTPTVHPYRGALVRNGFGHKKRTIHLSYRYLRAPASKFAFLTDRQASVHIMAADTDLV